VSLLKSNVVVVTGGRDFEDQRLVATAIEALAPSILIHGNAPGADTLCGFYAASKGIPVLAVPALWDVYGKPAGVLRNGWMREIAEDMARPHVPTLLHFPGGAGTANMVTQVSRSTLEWNTVDATTLRKS
jgi:hypothetical protein